MHVLMYMCFYNITATTLDKYTVVHSWGCDQKVGLTGDAIHTEWCFASQLLMSRYMYMYKYQYYTKASVTILTVSVKQLSYSYN